MSRAADDHQLAAVQARVAQLCKLGGPRWDTLLTLLATVAPPPPARPARPATFADELAAQYPGVVIPFTTRVRERAARRRGAT